MASVLDTPAPGRSLPDQLPLDQVGLLEEDAWISGRPLRRSDLPAIQHAAADCGVKRRKGMIALASCKGGVGKTWLSVNLCQAFAELGQKTLLVDAHFAMAHVALQLGLDVENDIGGALTGRATLAEIVEDFDAGGFDIVAGRRAGSLPRCADTVAGRRIADDLVELAASYDTVVMDLEPKLTAAGRQILDCAGTVIVVVTCDLASIASAYEFIRNGFGARANTNLSILVNAADDMDAGYRAYEMLRQACVSLLEVNPVLAGIVRYDDNVHASIMRQVPIFRQFPESPAAVDVGLIAANLLSQRTNGTAKPKQRNGNGARPFATTDPAVAPRFVSEGMLRRTLSNIGMPDGLDRILVREIRAMSDVGLTFMTLMGEIEDRASCQPDRDSDEGIEPVEMRRLLAKVRDALKPEEAAAERGTDGVIPFGDWEIDLRRREAVASDGRLAPLTRAEFDVVAALVQEKGRAVSRDYLLDVISHRSLEIGERTVDTLISRIRQKLQPGSRTRDLIVTERGIGYRANLGP